MAEKYIGDYFLSMAEEHIALLHQRPKDIKKRKDLMLEALASELSVSAALRYAGITEEEYKDICRMDANFAELAENAAGLVKTQAIINVTKAIMKGDTRTSKWYLERTSEEFSTKQKVSVEANPVKIPVEEKEQELAKIIADFEVVDDEQ